MQGDGELAFMIELEKLERKSGVYITNLHELRLGEGMNGSTPSLLARLRGGGARLPQCEDTTGPKRPKRPKRPKTAIKRARKMGLGPKRVPINTEKVRQLIEARKYTHLRLAKKLGFLGTGTVISAWINGKTDPSEAMFEKLAEILKVQPQEIVGKTYTGFSRNAGKPYTGKYARKG